MLVLTRKEDESIIIDGKIVVKVIGISGDKVRLGIEAPKEIKIHREEVYERIQAEAETQPLSVKQGEDANVS